MQSFYKQFWTSPVSYQPLSNSLKGSRRSTWSSLWQSAPSKHIFHPLNSRNVCFPKSCILSLLLGHACLPCCGHTVHGKSLWRNYSALRHSSAVAPECLTALGSFHLNTSRVWGVRVRMADLLSTLSNDDKHLEIRVQTQKPWAHSGHAIISYRNASQYPETHSCIFFN